jgi:hypothetical protein
MSASPPIATKWMLSRERTRCAISGLMHRSRRRASVSLFDDLVGADEQCRRHVKAERLGGFRLITSSYLVGACTGSSAGLARSFLRQSFELSFNCIC